MSMWYEAQADLKFLTTYRRFELDYNEPVARAELKRERAKGEKADEDRINLISREIHESQAVKLEVMKINQMVQDLPKYIEELDKV